MFAEPRLIALAMGSLMASLLLATAFQQYRRVAITSSCLVCAAAFGLIWPMSASSTAALDWLQRDWFHSGDGLPVVIELRQTASWPVSLLLTAMFASWALAARKLAVAPTRIIVSWLGLQFAVTLAATANDLLVVLLSWLVIEELSEFLATTNSPHDLAVERTTAGPRLLMPLRLSSLLLLGAMGLLQARYHSTSIDELLSTALRDQRVDAAVARGGCASMLAGAIILRLGLFPFSLWLKRLVESRSPLRVPLLTAIVVPAFSLGLRLIPLWRATDETPLLFVMLGLLGLLPLTLTAALHHGTASRCCVAIVTLSGLAGMSFGTSSDIGPQAAVGVLAIALLMVTRLDRDAPAESTANESASASSTDPKSALTDLLSELLRVPRRWWYIEEVTTWLWAIPLKVIAAILEFFDRVVLCGSKETAWTRKFVAAAEFLDAIRLGKPKYYALVVVWVATGLIAVAVLGRS